MAEETIVLKSPHFADIEVTKILNRGSLVEKSIKIWQRINDGFENKRHMVI